MSAAAAPLWRRPVRRSQLLAVFAGVLLLWAAGSGAAAWVLYTHYAATMSLRDQPISLRLPGGLPARAMAETPVQTRLDWEPTLSVPVNQLIRVQLPPTLSARAQTQLTIPIATNVSVATQIPVTVDVDTEVEARSWLPKFRVQMPVHMVVPVAMTVPIQTELPIALDATVRADITEPLNVPVRATLRAKVPLHARVQARAVNQAEFELMPPEDNVAVSIKQAEVRLPLDAIRLHQRDTAPPAAR